MLKVLPVRDKEKQKEYCALLSLEYDPDLMCFAACESESESADDGKEQTEEFLGLSLFHIAGDVGVIDLVKLKDGLDDYLARYLLAKAPLNFVDLCGIHKATYRDSDRDLARKMEFVEKDGVFTLDLTNYFTSPCSRHKESAQ